MSEEPKSQELAQCLYHLERVFKKAAELENIYKDLPGTKYRPEGHFAYNFNQIAQALDYAHYYLAAHSYNTSKLLTTALDPLLEPNGRDASVWIRKEVLQKAPQRKTDWKKLLDEALESL